MKLLVIYSSRGGASKKCAEILSDRLSGSFDTEVYDIENTPPAPDGFDVAVIGGSIRMCKLNKKLKAYLSKNAEALNNIHTAVFLCCGFTENFDDYVNLQVPKSVLADLGIHCFGGELKPKELKGMDKLAVKMMRSSITTADFESPDPNASPLPEIIPENIYRLADRIRALL